MPFNPKTYNLLQSTDISNALEKAVEHLDNSEHDNPSIFIEHKQPFALRMKMYRYIRAFAVQMRDKSDVVEDKYNHLVVTNVPKGVMITSALEQKPLTLTTEKGEEL